MPTKAPRPNGRPPRPAALKRDRVLRVRLNALEETAAQARAEAAGLKVADYVRQQACGTAPEQTVARVAEVQRSAKATERAPGDKAAVEQRIRREQPGLPERSYRTLAAREMGRGR